MVKKIHIGILFLAIAIAHFSFYRFDLYNTITSLDKPMHFAGGSFLALLWLWIVQQQQQANLPTNKTGDKQQTAKLHFLTLIFSLIGFVLLFGITWEFFEYLSWIFLSDFGRYFALYDPLVSDLLADLLMDLVGGIVVGLVYYIKRGWLAQLVRAYDSHS